MMFYNSGCPSNILKEGSGTMATLLPGTQCGEAKELRRNSQIKDCQLCLGCLKSEIKQGRVNKSQILKKGCRITTA